MLFSTIYIVICINIASYVDDLSMSVPPINQCIGRRISIKKTLKWLIDSHLNCFRWTIIAIISRNVRVPLKKIGRIFSFFSITGVVFFTSINCMLCFFITISTANGMVIGDLAYDLYWYQLLPHDQFIVQTIIQRPQKPCELRGLGVFACSLATFLKVHMRRTLNWIEFITIWWFFSDGPKCCIVLHGISEILSLRRLPHSMQLHWMHSKKCLWKWNRNGAVKKPLRNNWYESDTN